MWTLALLIVGLMGLGVESASAQQTEGEPPHPSLERDGLPPADTRQDPTRSRAAAMVSKEIAGYTEVTAQQEWILNSDPNSALNFNILGTPTFAGDVNGDGTNDYLYAATAARDERTTGTGNLSDNTGKTALFYGGTSGTAEDQLLYTDLRPVGDLNGDGYDDAIHLGENNIDIYEGTTTGYQDSGEDIPIDRQGVDVYGFSDLDGDGNQDVLLSVSLNDVFWVIYGNSDLGAVSYKGYTPDSGLSQFTYNTANLDETGGAEIVRLASAQNFHVEIFGISTDGNRTLTEKKSFEVEGLSGQADYFDLSAVDVDGGNGLDLVVGQYQFSDADTPTSPTHVFQRSSGSYPTAPTASFNSNPRPVGDLDGDGRHDFVTFDGSTGDRYVSYGPSTVSDGLTFDTQIPANGNGETNQSMSASLVFPTGGLGDVTGDGTPDVVLPYDTQDRSSTETVGRQFFSVDTGRNVNTQTEITYPREHFYDRIAEVNEIGDFNDDGVTDFAIVRYQMGQVEIFYGGDPISSSPDLTITPPTQTLFASNVTSGDFNDDGVSDLLVGYAERSGAIKSVRNDMYFGGSTPSTSSDHTVQASDVGFPLSLARAIGDVNDDGVTDWMAADLGNNADYGGTGQNVAIFFGGSSPPTTADQTMQYAQGNYTGEVNAALGDVNGDGVDDFALMDANNNEVDVFFGGSSPSFSSSTPDLELSSPYYYMGIAGGDFNGDGTSDIAFVPYNDATIRIVHGGSGIDATVDQELRIPAGIGGGDTDGDGFADRTIGAIESAGDIDGNGADELIHGSSFSGFSTHALLFHPSSATRPVRVFRAPNTRSGLGAGQFIWSMAIGDFTGDGTVDFVGSQFADNNDAASSSRVYRYPVDLVVASETKTVSDGESEQDFTETGTSISFSSGTSTSGGSGSVTVDKYDGGPANPGNVDTDNVSTYRVVIEASDVSVGSGTTVRFSVSNLDGVDDPNQVTILKRSTPGVGEFDALSTEVNDQGTEDPTDDVLYATVSEFSEFAFGSDTEPLPVEMAQFGATLEDESVRLRWQTASEQNNAGFRVQRKRADDGTWTTLGRVDGAGTVTEAQSYRFQDEDLPYEAETLTYRLAQVDVDGTVSYSDEVSVQRDVDTVELLGTYPNPARQQVTVRYALPDAQDVTVEIYDVLGRQVQTVVSGEQRGRHERTVDVSGLSSGVYFLRLRVDGDVRNRKMTITR